MCKSLTTVYLQVVSFGLDLYLRYGTRYRRYLVTFHFSRPFCCVKKSLFRSFLLTKIKFTRLAFISLSRSSWSKLDISSCHHYVTFEPIVNISYIPVGTGRYGTVGKGAASNGHTIFSLVSLMHGSYIPTHSTYLCR